MLLSGESDDVPLILTDETEGLRAAGVLAVEMEAAALYAFAAATGHDVICLAHLTNDLGSEGDFEKTAADGTEDALRLLEAILPRLEWSTGLRLPHARHDRGERI